MRYLILGSEGQIGGHLQDYLRSKGHSVTEFDIEITSDHDLRKQNNKELYHALKYADFVFFLAFDVGGSRYLKKYQETFEFYRNNMMINTEEDLVTCVISLSTEVNTLARICSAAGRWRSC